jgi:signal transduction histidine kinase
MTRLVSWAVVAAVVSGVTINVLRLRADVSLAGTSLLGQVLEVAAGALLIVVGGACGRGSERWLLPASGIGWLAAEWANPASPSAAVFTFGLIAALLSLPLVLASRLPRPVAKSSWPALGVRLLSLLAIALALTAAITGGPLAAMMASPQEEGCSDCARDLIALTDNPALSSRLTELAARLAIAVGVVAAVWLVAKIASTRPRGRRWSWSPDTPADLCAIVFAGAISASSAVIPGEGADGPLTYLWREIASAALLFLAVSVGAPALRMAWARRVVAKAAVAVAHGPTGSAAEAIAAALGDPGLRVAYPFPDGLWRDRRGQPVTLPDRDLTLITNAGVNVAALIHERPARVSQAVLTGAISAARVLLDTERVEAGALARVDDLTRARRLVVDAADAARARVERDLHDGAQRSLVALRYALGLATVRAGTRPAVTARLSDADGAAEKALADLRELSQGITSSLLSTDGLASAVRSAAELTSSLVTITELPAGWMPARTERAAYRFVAGLLRELAEHSVSAISIAIRREGLHLAIEVRYDEGTRTTDWPPAYLADGVAAAGGQLRLTELKGHVRLSAELPCE